jgi:hypothetical protein
MEVKMVNLIIEITTIIIISVLYIVFYERLNTRYIKLEAENRALKEALAQKEKPKQAEISPEQKEKMEKAKKHFENLMGYDYEIALKKE